MRYRPNARGDLPGPGDASPPDPPELADVFLDEARDVLEANREDDEAPITEDEVTALAWELQAKCHRECREAEAEMRAWDAEDDLPY